MVLNEDCRLALQWWIDNVYKECNSIQRGKPDIVIRSDSSGFGWGGFSETDQRQTGVHRSIEEQKEHINYIELNAGFLNVKAFYSHVSNVSIRLYMYNSVSVFYLNNMGGQKKKFNTLTKMICLWSIDRNIILSSAHIAGSDNLTADRLWRDRNIDKEWKLNINIFFLHFWSAQY